MLSSLNFDFFHPLQTSVAFLYPQERILSFHAWTKMIIFFRLQKFLS